MMARSYGRLWSGLALLGIVLWYLAPCAAMAQTPEAPVQPEKDPWLDDTLAGMSTADKVGQLFLVTFEGGDAAANSDIARLVQSFRVGGVILAPENRNFSNSPSAPDQVLSLTTALQELAFSASMPVTITRTVPVTFTAPPEPSMMPTPAEPEVRTTVVTVTDQITYAAQGVPLLIGVSQEGDGYPHTALRTGFTELPSSMALGATWDDTNAEAVGSIVGRELSAVGINLLFGPSLDVLRNPRPGLSDHLGTRVYGGDPYWAGRMGTAYIAGVHRGSEGRVATVAKHLPGLGESDRSLEEEVATVDKSLQDLRLIELPPFFAVTEAGSITETTDALMTAHIRYRGFQGNIRYVTPPISLHAQGMEQILGLNELATWRENGGVLVSDSLGVPAVRRYYSPELASFPHRQIALDAFQAGNDLLMLSRFALDDSWETQLENIEDTILFFRTRYEADESFRARVDESVRRILSLKRRVCPEFSLDGCTSDPERLVDVGSADGTVAEAAQEAVTLLYPSADELALQIPRPPRLDENVLIFSDSREAVDCDTCTPFYVLDPEGLRDVILQMYGPDASDQVDPDRISAFTLGQLHTFLETGSPDLNQYMADADWIIFAMLDYSPEEYPSSSALKQFLKERAVGPEPQKVVVLAYDAPWYLDTTEVSKLSAYYAMYGGTEQFIETSVRALFSEFGLTGRSPVTVEGVGYDLVRQLAPDPRQMIAVMTASQPAETEGTPQPLSLEVGDSLGVRTSVIVDQNGNAVPDGTPVTFRYVYQGEGLGGQVEVVTLDGVATVTITLEREGELQITATSDQATNSSPLVVRLFGETTEILTPTPSPSPTPTPTPTATPTPTITPSPTATPVPSPTAVPEPPPPPPPEPRVRWVDLVLAVLGAAAAGGVVLLVARSVDLRTDMLNAPAHLALWSGACGLGGYLFYGLALPGSAVAESMAPGLRGLLIGFVWGLLPLIAVGWLKRRDANSR
jgi:beta-N-acetylhexosaminidase